MSEFNFYPRPPRGGRRLNAVTKYDPRKFLSTPSARRATQDWSDRMLDLILFLSTPSARRATNGNTIYDGVEVFLSTPSARRATFR